MKKAQKNFCSKFIPIGVFFLVVLLDQMSKYWAQTMNLVVVNSGISFSIFSNLNISNNLLIITLILLILMVMVFLLKNFSKSTLLSTIFIAAAFSNLLDRIVFSGVRDWLIIPILGLKNNFADWLMFLSIIFLFIKKYKTCK